MTPEQRRVRASRIRELMQDGEIAAAFDDVKAQFVSQWETCRDAAERDNLWRAVDVVNRVRGSLAAMAAGEPDGSVSAIRRVK
jgi:hypothetical protein